MRCPDCNKFVPYNTETDPEITASVDDEGVITGDVRIVNCCEECGNELTEATFSVDADVSGDVAAHREEMGEANKSEHDALDLDDDGGNRVDEMQTTDRRGKKITNPRYMKRLYGAEVTFTVTCKCGERFDVLWRDTLPASAMESLV